jgi:histidine phosphotransferase ChpT
MLFGRSKIQIEAATGVDAPAAGPSGGLDTAFGGTELAMLIASRICHDLISPVGAIGNGVELIEQFGASGKQEMSLIADSAMNASGLLQLFRLAFGSGNGTAAHGLDPVRKVLDARYSRDRATLVWRPARGAQTTRLGARLICLGCMGAAAALPRGGDIVVEAGEDLVIRVTATGPTLRIDEHAPLWLAGREAPEPPAPRDVQWLAANALAREGGAAVTLEQDENALRFTAALPTPS